MNNETNETPRRQRGLVSLACGQQESALIRLLLEDARTRLTREEPRQDLEAGAARKSMNRTLKQRGQPETTSTNFTDFLFI